MYNYGKSIISTNLKYEFNNKNSVYSKILDEFHLELKVYCESKKMYEICKDFKYTIINNAISEIFRKKLEKQNIFHKGHNYYATFKVFKLMPITRYKYEKTDTIIDSNRRKYLLQERINIYF